MFTIRHIRTMLTTSLGLTKSGVKWDALDSMNGLNGNQDNRTPDQLLDRAKELITLIKEKDTFNMMNPLDWSRMNELRGIMNKLGNENQSKRNSIMDGVTKAADDTSISSEDRTRFQKLRDEWNKEYKKTDMVAGVPVEQSPAPVETRTSIQSRTEAIVTPVAAPAKIEARPLPSVEASRQVKENTKSLKDNISRLADLNNDSEIDASLRDVVNEDVLLRALSYVTNGGQEDKVKKVYKTVTGNDVTNFSAEEVKDFQTKLRTSLMMIQKLTGGNAGLYVLLTGQLGEYAAEIKKLDPKPVVTVDEMKGLTPEMQNLIGALATAGVLVLTGGVVMVSHSAESTTVESVLKDLDRSTLGKAWDWIKDAFTGRRLAFSLGQDKMSVGEYKDKVRDFAKEAITLEANTEAKDIQNPDLKKLYPIAQKIARDLGMSDNKDAIQKAAIQAYVQNLGVENTGSDWTAKIGLLFIGANRDAISPTVLATKYSKFNEIEARLMKQNKNNSNSQTTGTDGISNNNDGKQTVDNVRNAREKNEKLNKNELAIMLYNVVGHSKPELFGPLLSAIKTRDPAEIDKAISMIEKSGYKTLAKMLQKDKANFETWTTYMYGTKDTLMNDNPTQEGVNKLRRSDVIAAENRLAKAAGITNSTPENQFSVGKNEKHTPTQVSAKFPGQEMTISVFATPRGGQHRIDAFDGSISMSQKHVELSGDYKNQIIDATLKDSGKGGIKSQFDKLNTFLEKNGKAKIENIQKYVDYLKTGEIGKLGVPELQVQKGKEMRVFEGRAMVAGNVCMNRMHGIVYPAFELTDGGRQGIPPVGTMDATAQLNAMGVDLVQSSVGINPVAAALKLSGSGKENGSSNQGPASDPNKGGGKINSTQLPTGDQ